MCFKRVIYSIHLQLFRSNVLVIDAQNVQHHFAHGFDGFCGGQHSEVEARVRRFVSALVEMGVTPVFVMNGPGCVPEAKAINL